jgi:aminoglycoside 3-N-acetyltransferase
MTDTVEMPTTRSSLAADFARLGVEAGATLLIHSSLKAVGWVVGGSVAVVQALLDAVGPDGTIVVPTQDGEYSDPAGWVNPPVPEAWWPVIRSEMPAFDPRLTPSRHMGIVAETVRTWPGARRSGHPAVSFVAIGAYAAETTAEHALEFGLGDRSPLGALYRRGALVLLIGVGYDRATAFHLAQTRLPGWPLVPAGAPLLEEGRRVWRSYREIDMETEGFDAIGAALEAAGHVRTGTVGNATARLFSLPDAVDLAQMLLAREPPR